MNDLDFELETVREKMEEKYGYLFYKIRDLEFLHLDQDQLLEAVVVLFTGFSLRNHPQAFLASFSTFLAIKMFLKNKSKM